MSDTQKTASTNRPHTALHDAFGLALIVLGAFLAVAAVMYLTGGAPENPALPAALMSGSVEWFGPAPILWTCLGFLFVGGRLYVFGGERGLLRDALGFVFTALGLSILMGAISEVQGGAIGSAIGGVVHPVFGVVLGGAWILAVAWVAWLRVAPPALVARASALVGDSPATETPGATSGANPARPAVRSAPRGRPATEDPSGVTTAEADALLPDDAEREEILSALRTANRHSASTVNHAPSPYPPDVRRDGGIPEGARPIEGSNDYRRPEPIAESPAAGAATRPEPAPRPAPAGGSAGGAGAVHVWSAPQRAAPPVAAGADLARGADARGATGTAPSAGEGELKSAAPARAVPPPAQGRTAAETARATPIPIPAPAGSPAIPSWEREEALRAEAAEGDAAENETAVDEVAGTPREPTDAEVVDAYGTPLELVAELRGRAPKPEPVADEASDDDGAVVGWRARPGDEEDSGDDAREAFGALVEERRPTAETEEDFDEELEATEEEAELDEDEGPEGRVEEEELAEEELAEEELAEEVLAEEELAEEELGEEGLDEAELDAPNAAGLEPDVAVAAALAEDAERAEDDEHDVRDVEDEGAEAAKPELQPEPAEREVVLQPVQPSLFDAPTPEVSAEKPPRRPAAEKQPERRVVLEPVAAPPARAASAATGEDLVYRCGLLFLRENRVAVSMLQREFGLDFKQATAVLDDLQAQGLIGPYLGGQRRDILLTAEEWRAKVGAST